MTFVDDYLPLESSVKNQNNKNKIRNRDRGVIIKAFY